VNHPTSWVETSVPTLILPVQPSTNETSVSSGKPSLASSSSMVPITSIGIVLDGCHCTAIITSIPSVTDSKPSIIPFTSTTTGIDAKGSAFHFVAQGSFLSSINAQPVRSSIRDSAKSPNTMPVLALNSSVLPCSLPCIIQEFNLYGFLLCDGNNQHRYWFQQCSLYINYTPPLCYSRRHQ
jgi:hypothetical protein